MGQRLALVLACMTAMFVPVRAGQKTSSNLVSSVLEFFEGHSDVSIDGFLGRLRPPPIDAVEHDRIVAALPPHGAIRPDAHDLAKMSLADDLLAYHGRRGLISFTIIDVAPVFVGLHARAVILVSAHALALVNTEEFAALVAHEIGHEYVWFDYEYAKQHHDQARIRELELRCDGIAVLTLRRLGLDPERLVSAVEKLTWYNQARGLDADRKDYVSREDRRMFIRAVAKLQWAVADVTRPTMTPHPVFTAPVLTTVLPSISSAQSVADRTVRRATAAGAEPLDATKAPPVDAHRDTDIGCGSTTRRGAENCIRTIRRALALLPRRPRDHPGGGSRSRHA
jgi:hypothetical protein